MEDLISREKAIEEIKAVFEWHDTVTMERMIEHFNNLPSAQPEKRTENTRKTHGVCLDTISRQAAIDAHYEYCNKHPDAGFPVWSLKILEDLPSVQPEIVRCKDCKHQVKEWRDDKRLKDKGYWVYGCKVISEICGYWAWLGQDDDFCSEAERRTDEHDDIFE